jgi:hypothetical protein
MKRKLMIACPVCIGGTSDYFKNAICPYCNRTKEVNILDHFKVLNIEDERLENVKNFVSDPRFVTDYLGTKNG